MASQYFPTPVELLEIILAELPEGTYPRDLADDPDYSRRTYSSAELRAAAESLATLYANLSLVTDDKSVGTATAAGIARWEAELLRGVQEGDIEERRQALLAKQRSSGGISRNAIYNVASAILSPKNLPFEILSWSGQSSTDGHTSAWELGTSELGVDTYLSLRDPLIGNRTEGGLVPLDKNLDYEAAGITQNDLTLIQRTAYTYEVVIYGHADPATLAALDKQLTLYEPARSTHVITNDASTNDPDPEIYLAVVPWR